jgi:hypothetical protein
VTGGRRALVAGAAAAVVVAGAVVYALAGGSPARPSAGTSPEAPLGGHQLLPGECVPVQGPVWAYPGPERISSDLYESFATNISCKSAAEWTVRLAALTVPVRRNGDPTSLAGPAGFTCIGWPDAHGHAYGGSCRSGTSAVEFGWNWNVINRRTVLEPNANGLGSHLAKPSRDDAGTALSALGRGRYLLKVQDESGIGDIDRFTWAPPAGWTITAVTGSAGGRCALAGGRIACRGRLRHPACLCTATGGVLVVRFTARAPGASSAAGHPVVIGTAGGRLTITAMTPVPFLIPDTPGEATSRPGV